MFLYEARARARLVQEHHEHNWDPTFGRFSLTKENRVFKPEKNIPGNKSWVGKGAAARPASAAGPKFGLSAFI